MVKINKIYTRTGDDGTTGLVGGSRIKKSSRRIEVVGHFDELNAVLGIIRTIVAKEPSGGGSSVSILLEKLQQRLFDAGAEVATLSSARWPNMALMQAEHTLELEKEIDKATENLPELRSFVLPGGCESNAFFHLARTVCRRLERTLLLLQEEEPAEVRPELLVYVNRLSDLLFALARAESKRTGSAEYLWIPGKA